MYETADFAIEKNGAVIVKLPDRDLRLELPGYVKIISISYKEISNCKKTNKYNQVYKLNIIWERFLDSKSKYIEEERQLHVSKGVKSFLISYNGGGHFTTYMSKDSFSEKTKKECLKNPSEYRSVYQR